MMRLIRIANIQILKFSAHVNFGLGSDKLCIVTVVYYFKARSTLMSIAI
jgi:hypothetical protein